MKHLIITLTLLITIQCINAQDRKVTQLPADTEVNSNDLFYVIDQGTTSKSMTGAVLMSSVGDTANQLRLEIDSAKTNIRNIIGGSGSFIKSGNYVYTTDNGDSVGIGLTPEYKLDVFGKIRATNALITPFIYLDQNTSGPEGLIWLQDGDIYFWSLVAGYQSLGNIQNFTSIGNTYTTLTPTNNWNFGGTTASSQKMTITGDVKVTQKSYLTDDILLAGANGSFGSGKPSIRNSGDTLQLEDYSGIYNLEDLIGGNVAGEFDTIHFSGTSSYITKNGTTGLKLSPNGGTEITFSTLSAPYGRNIGNVESILFSTPSGDEYFRGFRTDTTSTDADTAMGWSISAVKDWVSSHGGGSGTLSGTMEEYAVPFGLTSSSLQIDETFHYNPSTGILVATNGFNSSGGELYLSPTTANGETAVANKIGTTSSYSSNARVFQVNNYITEKLYIKNDTTVITNNLRYRGDLYSWKYRALTDTLGLVLYPGGRVDTASLVFAAKGWDYKLKPFRRFFKESKNVKALPLPYPDGTERRQLNPVYRDYQIEFELERINRYMKRNFDGDMIRSLIIGLLVIGFIYQQFQISKLKKK